jgi:hypothetical protein
MRRRLVLDTIAKTTAKLLAATGDTPPGRQEPEYPMFNKILIAAGLQHV